MESSRRTFLERAGAGLLASPVLLRSAARPQLRIGVMDNVVGFAGKPEAVAAAAAVGAEGLQLTVGRPDSLGYLPLIHHNIQGSFLEASETHKVALVSTYLDVLHQDCLKNAESSKRWVRQGIEITSRLKAPILMLVFFGKCALVGRADLDAAVAVLRELAPEAEAAGVVLGFENLLAAEDNSYVLDKVGSPALRVYCDVGNLTNLVGVDAPGQIRKLGKRICQFHLKDAGYLGEGKVNCRETLRAIREIGYEGWLVLETGAPSKDRQADTRRNLAYVRKTIQDLERGVNG